MPARSKITKLPEHVKRELDKRLISGSFSDYRKLSAWLQEQGYEISRSAINRYGQAFEERLAAIKIASEQARAVSEAVGDRRRHERRLISLWCRKGVRRPGQPADQRPVAFAKIFPNGHHGGQTEQKPAWIRKSGWRM